MNVADDYGHNVDTPPWWLPHQLAGGLRSRLRRMVKRRLRGESHRQWIERNLNASEAGVAFDVTQCIFSLLMVGSTISQNWLASNFVREGYHRSIDVANLVAITLDYSFRTAKSRQGALIGLTAVCIIICAAATFQTIEQCDSTEPGTLHGFTCQNLSFFDSMYFVCITIGTVGYGEYAPKSKMGKLVDIFLIIFTGILIPTQISGYTEILSRETAFDRKYTPDHRVQHILVCGDIDNGSLHFFLHNWLHCEGERGSRRKVIILAPRLPSSSVRRVLLHRDYEQRVVYIQGSAMDTDDLQRAAAPSAAYCFIIVRKHKKSFDMSDTATNLVTCAVRKNNRLAPVYVQVSKTENIRHINISGATSVVCLEQLKLTIFAKSLWILGLNAFLGNTIQRFEPITDNRGSWLTDYTSGCCQRIFEATLPSFLFAVATFRSLAILIYREFGVPVIGIRTAKELVMIYPVDKEIGDINFQSIFFISKSNDTVMKIEKMTISIFTRHTDISPHVDMSAHKSNRTVNGVLSSIGRASRDSHFNPFSRLSVQGSSRGSVQFFSNRMHSQRPPDKITPLNGDDGAGDSVSYQVRLTNLNGLKKSVIDPMGKTVCHPTSLNGDDDDMDSEPTHGELNVPIDTTEFAYNRPNIAVVALSPAELIKKATATKPDPEVDENENTTPRSPRLPRKSPRKTNTPRIYSPRSARFQSPYVPTSERVGDTSPKSASKQSPSGKRNNVCFGSTAEQSYGPTCDAIESAQAPSSDEAETSPTKTSPTKTSPPKPSLSKSPPFLRRPPQANEGSTLSVTAARASLYRSFRRSLPPKDLTGHFVICGIPSNYTLMFANITVGVPIVFVTPCDLVEADYAAYVQHKHVYFVRGSPVSINVFNEARMLHARSILIMSYCGGKSMSHYELEAEQLDENMADVDAITTHRFIMEACQQQENQLRVAPVRRKRSSGPPKSQTPYIVVEMMRPSNVKFLGDQNGCGYDDQSVEHQQRVHDLVKDTKVIDDAFFSPLYAGGHIYFSNVLDSLLASSSDRGTLIDIVTQLLIGGNSGTNQPDKCMHQLTQITAPVRYHNRPYAVLVEGLLVNENAMALGIYRASPGFDIPPFVFTNPAANDIVHPQDRIFVIK